MNKIETYNSEAIDSILRNLDPKLEKQVEFRMKLAAKIDTLFNMKIKAFK